MKHVTLTQRNLKLVIETQANGYFSYFAYMGVFDFFHFHKYGFEHLEYMGEQKMAVD